MDNILENLRFNQVTKFETKKYVRGTYRKIVNRPYYGLLFCLNGKVRYFMKDEEHLGDVNHVILVPKNSTYEFNVEEDCVIPILNFELDHGYFDNVYSFEIEETETFYLSILQMERRHTFATTSYELMNLSSIYDLISRINGYGKKDDSYKVIEKAERFLEENINNYELTVRQIAEEGNISEVYFRKMFKRKHNISPNKYINEIRIKKAKSMLIDIDADINEIADQCGFSSIYSFSRAFKNIVGISPANFRKKYLITD